MSLCSASKLSLNTSRASSVVRRLPAPPSCFLLRRHVTFAPSNTSTTAVPGRRASRTCSAPAPRGRLAFISGTDGAAARSVETYALAAKKTRLCRAPSNSSMSTAWRRAEAGGRRSSAPRAVPGRTSASTRRSSMAAPSTEVAVVTALLYRSSALLLGDVMAMAGSN
ncbi:hypothetical protein CFC21_035568 [Triticum aestivum]|uniref:Uncharacterized protein n=4 Tax=Triticum TaxID=4564 RepID=A0A9R0RKC6_TRITD|nr:hypothetical protein TRIUR3_10201 [Triticum urartu]KAF7022941.1 hypothetical protein CFC21_035568 [Triticum aestivum]VAH62101.1 unnamed protein product [Triticum turgidum subsp. durum]